MPHKIQRGPARGERRATDLPRGRQSESPITADRHLADELHPEHCDDQRQPTLNTGTTQIGGLANIAPCRPAQPRPRLRSSESFFGKRRAIRYRLARDFTWVGTPNATAPRSGPRCYYIIDMSAQRRPNRHARPSGLLTNQGRKGEHFLHPVHDPVHPVHDPVHARTPATDPQRAKYPDSAPRHEQREFLAADLLSAITTLAGPELIHGHWPATPPPTWAAGEEATFFHISKRPVRRFPYPRGITAPAPMVLRRRHKGGLAAAADYLRDELQPLYYKYITCILSGRQGCRTH